MKPHPLGLRPLGDSFFSKVPNCRDSGLGALRSVPDEILLEIFAELDAKSLRSLVSSPGPADAARKQSPPEPTPPAAGSPPAALRARTRGGGAFKLQPTTIPSLPAIPRPSAPRPSCASRTSRRIGSGRCWRRTAASSLSRGAGGTRTGARAAGGGTVLRVAGYGALCLMWLACLPQSERCAPVQGPQVHRPSKVRPGRRCLEGDA